MSCIILDSDATEGTAAVAGLDAPLDSSQSRNFSVTEKKQLRVRTASQAGAKVIFSIPVVTSPLFY